MPPHPMQQQPQTHSAQQELYQHVVYIPSDDWSIEPPEPVESGIPMRSPEPNPAGHTRIAVTTSTATNYSIIGKGWPNKAG
jgi:hypothetical protein